MLVNQNRPRRLAPSCHEPASGMDESSSHLEVLFAEAISLADRIKLIERQVSQWDPGSHLGRNILGGLKRHGPQTVPQIARSRNVSRQHIQTIVNHLANQGRVEFVGNPAHQRSRLVRISPRGTELLNTINRQEAARWVGLGELLSEEEMRSSRVVLQKLREWIDCSTQGAIPPSLDEKRKVASPKKNNARPMASRKADRPPRVAPVVDAFFPKPDWEELPVSLL